MSFAKDNPANDQAYLDTLDNLKGVYRDRMALGLWVQAEGLIYDQFDANKHVVTKDGLLSHWHLYKADQLKCYATQKH